MIRIIRESQAVGSKEIYRGECKNCGLIFETTISVMRSLNKKRILKYHFNDVLFNEQLNPNDTSSFLCSCPTCDFRVHLKYDRKAEGGD